MTTPLTPVTHKLYFREGELNFDQVRQLSKEWYMVLTWNGDSLVYAIVLELSPTGRVNATISN